MKDKTTDKGKSIKPKETKDEAQWLQNIKVFLGQLAPEGNINKYFQVEFFSDPGFDGDSLRKVRKVEVTFFTHTYRYRFSFTEKMILGTALTRKPYAGTDDTCCGTDIIRDMSFSMKDEEWRYVLNQIIAWELVKVFKEARTEERSQQWQRLNSHYSVEGKEMYHEWEQKGTETRNQRIFERVK